jgi:hypothetical protein
MGFCRQTIFGHPFFVPLGTKYWVQITNYDVSESHRDGISNQYLVPLGPRNPNKILPPITGYYFLDSPEFGENQKVPGQLPKMGLFRYMGNRKKLRTKVKKDWIGLLQTTNQHDG